jgi:hypothetical protein
MIVRYTAAVVAVWLVVILYKLPSITAPSAGGRGYGRGRNAVPEDTSAKTPLPVVKPPIIIRGRTTPPPPEDTTPLPPADDGDGDLPEVGDVRHRGVNDNNKPTQPQRAGGAKQAVVGRGTGKWPRVATPTNLDSRREDVVKMLRSSWQGYRRHAWGYDEFAPISKHMTNWGHGKGIGATIVDALDTLLIAGLDEEAAEAIEWCENTLTFDQNIKLSGFETTIRVLGGLLSAYQITGRQKLLDQAHDLGRRLLVAFDTPSGVPDNYVNLQNGGHEGAAWNGGAAILSELGSLQMEHFTLSAEVGEPKFFAKARRAVEAIKPSCGGGYCPRQFHGASGTGGSAGLGSFGDSFYEYLLKQWVLSGKSDAMFKEMWDKAAKHTIETSLERGKLLVPNGHETGGTMEHLACFSGGLFALSYMHTDNKDHLHFAERIAETCHAMYQTPTGLAPDVAVIDGSDSVRATDPKYILRPETVETYFYLWKATKKEQYRDWGYEVVQAIEKHLKVPGAGYAGALDVYHTPVRLNDNMETFWFAETLKYLYMLFSEDELIDLHQWVFNTEAHPFRVQPAAGGIADA